MQIAEPASIELANCSLILDGQAVLQDVSFTLRRGERWALIGANGSGKTFLLKMLRGDVWPTPTGHERRCYRFDGNVSNEPRNIKQYMAYVGSEHQDKYIRYGWNLSVTQLVTTGLFDEDIPLTRPSRAQRERVARVIRRFSLWGLRDRRFLSLSYGQRRLALVARAFAGPAKVLLLDEVFNGLDASAKRQLRQALERPRGGHDWILTSHRPKELPANVTHIAEIVAGRIVSAGPVSSPDAKGLMQRSGPTAVVRRYDRAVEVSEADDPVPVRAKRSGGGAEACHGVAKTGSIDLPAALRSRPAGPKDSTRRGWLVRIRNADVYRDYRRVIRGLHWTLNRGEHWAVLGANGSGKSTLLSLLHGDLHPALGGTIERWGCPFGTPIERWKRRTGWVSPELHATHETVQSIEQVVISGRYSSVGLSTQPTAQDLGAARRWMRFFGIERLRERRPRQVSYGQFRLALLARAMVNDPWLLLLDEPCTGLDGTVRAHVLSFIEAVARGGTQVVMAVHDSEDIVPSIRHVLNIQRGGRTTTTLRAAQPGLRATSRSA
ncbi:ATP-binding cassette domain-containing protein [Steroidobacter denitrificans]|uniref:ATP-binding cassette domain-containing protein n=1 Tax=Steroidobacter denitrificans TaxID=465721 RepID=UPI000A656D7B|nr:ATP-binding cassette domain-containing protein [Steroidobacter denitrificans]